MSTVIKVGSSGPVLNRLTTVDLADHLAEARSVVAAAQRRAEAIVSDAERQSESTLEAARKDGYREGYRQGHESGTTDGHHAARAESIERFEQQHAVIVNDMKRATEEIDRLKGDLLIAAERDLLEFAIAIAERLTMAVGELHRDAAVENVRRALRLIASKTDLSVRVNPRDVEALRMFAPSVLDTLDGSTALSIVEDSEISPGGCIVQTARAHVDATLETQVKEMVALLLGGTNRNG